MAAINAASHGSALFNVSVTDPTGLVSQETQTLVGQIAKAAADHLGQLIIGAGSVEIEVRFDTSVSAANGSILPARVASGTVGGLPLADSTVAYELRTGVDTTPGADQVILVNPSWLANTAFLDTTLSTASDIPTSKQDFYSVLVHEMIHGLGFASYKNSDGTIPSSYIGTFDNNVSFIAGVPYFVGSQAVAVNGGPVALTPGNQSHYGTIGFSAPGPLTQGIMNGVFLATGVRYDLNDLDVAILRDIGLNVSVAGDARAQLYGSLGDDVLTATVPSVLRGLSGNDQLRGSSGNDVLYGGGGSDFVNGGAGFDVAVFSGARSSYTVTKSGGSVLVTNSQGASTVQETERIVFDDARVALDLTGAAGAAARLMTIVLGPSSVDTNQALLGTVISLYEQGLTTAQLAQIVVGNGIMSSAAGGSSNANFVQYVYSTFAGVEPTPAQAAPFVDILNSGALSQAQLLSIAVDHPLTQSNVEARGMLSYTSALDPITSVDLVGVGSHF